MVHVTPTDGKKLPAAFYRTETGIEPVRDWLKSRALAKDDLRIIGRDIAVIEYGWPVGMPTCEALGHGLWEVRTNLPNNRITRILFCITGGRMLLLHGFLKKSTRGVATPKRELDKAHDRQKDAKRRAL